MRHRLCEIAIALLVLTFVVPAAAAGPAALDPSCEQIRKACEQAGFVSGGTRTGKGIRPDCIGPIMNGTSAVNPTMPLPSVGVDIVAQCRAADPEFALIREQPTADGATANPSTTGDSTNPAQISTPLPAGLDKPNIVFVLTDDLSMNLLPYMPNVQAMEKDGVSFANYFVTDSLCCPSRASIFTGKFPHNTGVITNEPPDGGYKRFNDRGNDAETFAVALQQDGYRTAMLGKYLNGYGPKHNDMPQGWDEWDVAGQGYAEFDYDLNQNDSVVHRGTAPGDYLTDVLAGIADKFIRRSASAPFFIEIASFAPHAPYTPAPRDAQAFHGLEVPRSAAFAARPDAAAPRWLQGIPPLSDAQITNINHDFRRRAQSVLAVDKMVGDLRATLESLGIADRTYVIFSSDNGYHMGEFSLRPGKMTPFDTDIHVPLVVVGPGVAKGAVRDEFVENIDLCPTFTDLGGGAGPTAPDGQSMVPLLLGAAGDDWPQSVLIEHHRPVDFDISDPDSPIPDSANPISYEALRTGDALYVEYEDGEIGFYDLKNDPDELKNIAGDMRVADLQRYRTAVAASRECAGNAACREAQRIPEQAAMAGVK